MTERALEIARMMGYDGYEKVCQAIGAGELILLKLPHESRLQVSNWLREEIPMVRGRDEGLADALDEIADGLDFASELERYPAGSDICEMDLPHGWPSYCEKAR
ncbi:MAG: hypothetical protein JXB35_08975 [Anaerolineae bacterium]|nr:hypothetical protein [Anaerolineae bacterium]